MKDAYLRVVSVQIVAYILTTSLLTGFSVFEYANILDWRLIALYGVYACLIFLPFWLLDSLFLRPLVYSRVFSIRLFIVELTVILVTMIIFYFRKRSVDLSYDLLYTTIGVAPGTVLICTSYAIVSYLLGKFASAKYPKR